MESSDQSAYTDNVCRRYLADERSLVTELADDADVGAQPFGGRGLSGTGPKAGGPHNLSRFGTEVAVSNNVTAVGGNASLLSLGSD